MNESERNFCKNINLNKYRNDDGTFNIYKVERPLNGKGGENAYKIKRKIHHECMAIGNEKNLLYFDYGTKEKGSLDFRIWDSKDKVDNWKGIKKVGTSNASDDDVKNILYGEESDEWTDHNDYNIFFIIV